MTAADIVVIFLAAGRGSRFGGGKLAATLAGRPLARHLGDRLAALPFRRKLMICCEATPEVEGFERLALAPPGAPLSRSIATGIGEIPQARAALIALADMPLVPTSHIENLARAFDGDRIATCVAERAMVPAIFGLRHFPALLSLQGDRGAAALLRGAPAILLEQRLALDIDTPEDLAQAEAIIQGR